jgi:hypothetical protein
MRVSGLVIQNLTSAFYRLFRRRHAGSLCSEANVLPGIEFRDYNNCQLKQGFAWENQPRIADWSSSVS